MAINDALPLVLSQISCLETRISLSVHLSTRVKECVLSVPTGCTGFRPRTFRAASPRDGFRESLHPNTLRMPMIKFSYFDIEAKGELTRLLLHAGNFDFEDHRIPISEWPGEHKAGTTFGQLPMLRWDGVELAQSMAIARLVVK